MKKNLFPVLSIICLTLSSHSLFAVFSVSLTPSSHNGYAVSCFGGVDGAINITVTGGTSPYTYRWSTGATTQNVSALAAGYYQVTVTDNNSATCSGNVTLTQPTAITLSVTPSIYSPHTTNISCYNCCNGYINISVGGGVTSYSYAWSSGQTTANVTNLCKNSYTIIVTDANGCSRGEHQVMTEPDKDTWTMTGNSGSSASTNFIGTTDNVDFLFKTNNSERLRIKANGDLKIAPFSGTEIRIAYIDENGILKAGSTGVAPSAACPGPALAWFDGFNPNDVVKCPTAGLVGIGTLFPQYKVDITGTLRNTENAYLATASGKGVSIGSTTVPSGIKLNVDGKVAIGNPPSYPGNYDLYVMGGILAEKVKVALSSSAGWSDFVFDPDYKLKSISELEEFIKSNKHLPEIPTTEDVTANGTDLGEIQAKLLQKIEELTLYIIQQDKRIEMLEQKLKH